MYIFELTTISDGGSENLKTGLVPGESYTQAMKNLAIEFTDSAIEEVTLNYLIGDGVLLLSKETLGIISKELEVNQNENESEDSD